MRKNEDSLAYANRGGAPPGDAQNVLLAPGIVGLSARPGPHRDLRRPNAGVQVQDAPVARLRLGYQYFRRYLSDAGPPGHDLLRLPGHFHEPVSGRGSRPQSAFLFSG